MKQKTLVLLATLIAIMLWACSEQASRQAESTSTTTLEEVNDSVFEEVDTLLLDEEVNEEPMPAAADEMFDDFIFLFDQSHRVQRSRVRFPLVEVRGNDTIGTTAREDWQHHYLFFQKDFCTALFNYRGQMQMEESTKGKWAEVEQIFLHQRLIHQYHFDRDTLGQWFLTEERRLGFDESELCSFLDFYRDFSTDSIFQRQHVSGQIRYKTLDEEMENEPLEGTISADQWFEFAPELPRDVITNIRYGQTYDNPNHIIFEMRGIANGLQVTLSFHQQAGVWRLTRLEN